MIRTKLIEECGLIELSDTAKINKMSEELQDDIYFIVPTGLYTPNTSANSLNFRSSEDSVVEEMYDMTILSQNNFPFDLWTLNNTAVNILKTVDQMLWYSLKPQ